MMAINIFISLHRSAYSIPARGLPQVDGVWSWKGVTSTGSSISISFGWCTVPQYQRSNCASDEYTECQFQIDGGVK